ncbi:hypothetical protein DFJ73DRAFT_836159 [Zopfochytrium polystomum]|nr:hypothetical protein DFJ73DRAFT_836159 [Zopfochytrium polystomum]
MYLSPRVVLAQLLAACLALSCVFVNAADAAPLKNKLKRRASTNYSLGISATKVTTTQAGNNEFRARRQREWRARKSHNV